MDYRNLGRTGTKVSPLCLGCMMFGAPAKTALDESMAMIDKALDKGINFLDTANVYTRGKSEEFTGQALKRNGKRGRGVLATKVHGRMADDDPNAWGNQRRHIVEQCDASLKRLQTDWIDLYQIHRPMSDIPIDETLRALDDLVRAGKVRYLGTSTFAAWQIMESLWASKELGLNRFICDQPPYHLLDRRIERELVPMAQTYGIGLIPWSPLAGGFLSGKYKRGQTPPTDARVQKTPGGRADYFFTDATFDVVEKLEAIAKEKGCSPSQAALSWCMNQPGITSPIIGPRTMAQLDDNLGALDVTLTDEHKKALDEVAKPGRATVPYYEADFGPHKVRWL
jgi:aryl-alcohol dehydrogenase-like predicted oxidoreductase